MPAPLLVPAIERGDLNIDELCQHYLEQFPKDILFLLALIIICYSKKSKNLTIIDPYSGIIKVLTPHTKKSEEIKPIKFLTTKYTEDLQINSEKIMQQKITWQEVIV